MMANETKMAEQLEELEKLADMLEGLEDVGDVKTRLKLLIVRKRTEALLAALESLENQLSNDRPLL